MAGLPTGLDGDGSNGIEFCWRDVILNALLAILILLILLMFQINPERENQAEDDKSPGSVIVEMSWDNTRDVDLDLWVQAPGDTPVGYSALAGKVFNLLRDDLGKHQDLADVNLENAYSRGIPEGEYCVNVHYYRDTENKGPIEATITIKTRAKSSEPAKQVLATKITMQSLGQEQTAFRFKLTKDGKLVEGSVHHVFKPLRSGSSGLRNGGNPNNMND